MDNLVGTDISTLSKGLAADITAVGSLSCVPSFVGLP